MYFQSDNWAGAHEAISSKLAEASAGFSAAYGESELDHKVEQLFSDVFERDVKVFFVGTGTAANSLALASVQRPGGAVFCHTEAHVVEDECGAPDFFSGMRMVPVPGDHGQINVASLGRAIDAFPHDAVHHGRAAAITITQATEMGTVYPLQAIETFGDIARRNALPLHMDGARFANALVALNTSPAEMTWRRGVDILSFGATKNGCWCAEAIVCFDKRCAQEMPFIRKRSAQLFSKSRFIAAQFEAYLTEGLWLDLARHANEMASRLRSGLAVGAGHLAWPTSANEVFAVVPKQAAANALNAGAHFYEWPIPSFMANQISETETLIRLVTSFATTAEHVDELLSVLRA
jgi:threonine aldolase